MKNFSKQIDTLISTLHEIDTEAQATIQDKDKFQDFIYKLKTLKSEVNKSIYKFNGKLQTHYIKNEEYLNNNVLKNNLLDANSTRDKLEDYYSITETLVFNHFTYINTYDVHYSTFHNETQNIIDNEGNTYEFEDKEKIQLIANKYNLTVDDFFEYLYELMDCVAN